MIYLGASAWLVVGMLLAWCHGTHEPNATNRDFIMCIVLAPAIAALSVWDITVDAVKHIAKP